MIKNNDIANELIDGGLGGGGHNWTEIYVEGEFRKVCFHSKGAGAGMVEGDYCSGSAWRNRFGWNWDFASPPRTYISHRLIRSSTHLAGLPGWGREWERESHKGT